MYRKIRSMAKNLWEWWLWFSGMNEIPEEEWPIVYGRWGAPPLMLLLFFILGFALTTAIGVQILRWLGFISD